MSDYICPYNCSYRTNSGFCGYTGGYDACQYRQLHVDAKPFGNGIDVCPVCGKPSTIGKPQTNADRIRGYTDEELAEFISGKARTFGEEYEGYMSALDWLRREGE